MTATPAGTYRPLLDILVDYVGLPLPDDCDAWGMRAVHPDLRSSHGYRYPLPGLAVAPGPILDHRGSCPEELGDGICTATTAQGMGSGGIPAITVLLTAHASAWVVGDSEPGKLRLNQLRVVEVVDLPGCARAGSLSGANLAGANLARANLAGANLDRANLDRANLDRADLHRADLSGANLDRANLHRANLAGADLHRADLSGANLHRANLHRANLAGARGIKEKES